MATNNIIDRAGASALMPEEYSTKFLEGLQNTSAVLQGFINVPVARAQVRFPVLSALPLAYWVNGDTGQKQTTQVDWKNKFLNIEEIAAIIPIPDNVVDDSDEPIWEQVSPLLEQATGRLLDETVFFGVNAPSTFPKNVVAAAKEAGNEATIGAKEAKEGGIVGDQSAMLSKTEADGFDLSLGVASRAFRGLARQARNTLGDRFGEVKITKETVELDTVTYSFPMRGQWPTPATGVAQAVAYDPDEFVVGIRSDVSWTLSGEAVIQGPNGEINYNLFQQDMHALRLTLRVGWQCANKINYEQPNEELRYPAGVLVHS